MKFRFILGLFLVLALAMIIFAKVIYPRYMAEKQYTENLAEASELLIDGNIKGGIAKLGHLVSIVGGMDEFEEAEKENIVLLLLNGASAMPLNSNIVLGFFDEFSIEPGCEQRLRMYGNFTKYSYKDIYRKRGSPDEMGEALYLTALWAGECKVGKKDLAIYRKVFELYKKKLGDSFVMQPWMEQACNGEAVTGEKQVAELPAAPVADSPVAAPGGEVEKPVVKEESVVETPVSSDTGEVVVEEQPVKTTDVTTPVAGAPPLQPPASDMQAVAKTVKAGSTGKKSLLEKVTGILRLGKTKDKQPAKKASGAPPVQSPASDMQAVAKTVKAESTGKKSLLEKVTGILRLRKTKDKQPVKKASGAKSGGAKDSLEQERKEAKVEIVRLLDIYGIKVTEFFFNADGTVLYLSFESGYIGSKKLAKELKTILSTIDERVQRTRLLPLRYMSIKLNDPAGRTVVKWEIEYDDYKEYRSGKINGAELMQRWKEETYE